MIIEIALGIVLGVIILALLPYIIGLAGIITVVALVLGLIGLAVWVLWETAGASIWAPLVSGIVALFVVARLMNRKWQHLETAEIMFALFFAVMLGLSTFAVLTDHSSDPFSIATTLVVDVAVIAGFFVWNRRKLAEWVRSNAVAESYSSANN